MRLLARHAIQTVLRQENRELLGGGAGVRQKATTGYLNLAQAAALEPEKPIQQVAQRKVSGYLDRPFSKFDFYSLDFRRTLR